MIKAALSQYGISEVNGVTNNEKILDYARELNLFWVKSEETSWCGIFMGWCAKQSGYQMPMAPHTARKWLTIGEEIEKPQIGDIVVFWRNNPASWMGHVGIFISEHNGDIWVLGGNQSDRVCIKPYPKSRLLGYRRPLMINSPDPDEPILKKVS